MEKTAHANPSPLPTVEKVRKARVAPGLEATLDGLRPLLYEGGALSSKDVPAHVRGASAIRRRSLDLVIVQDDVNVLALYHPDGRTEALLLPPGPDGRRTFDKSRGNKALKADLEACARLPDGRLVAFGSGSNAHRETLVVLTVEGTTWQKPASLFYQELRRHKSFAGSELNMEGALVVGNDLLLFQRGNGATRDGQKAVNAIGVVALESFLRWLAGEGAVPSLVRIVPVDLGSISNVPLGFTDAALGHDGRVVVIACAEASANTLEDGAVTGCRFGYLTGDELLLTNVVDLTGRPTSVKIEGLEAHPDSVGIFDVVTDADDPEVPARLGRLSINER